MRRNETKQEQQNSSLEGTRRQRLYPNTRLPRWCSGQGARLVNRRAWVQSQPRHYFALQTNPGEQFFMFTSLAAWLFSKAGLSMEAPQESDDPNSLIATILDLTRQLNIPVDFPPNKLKQGYGPHVIYILDAVADKAIDSRLSFLLRPQPPKEVTTEEVIVEDDSELLLEKIEEEMIAEISSEDEDALMNIEDLHRMNNISFQDSSSKPDHVLESNVDETEWRLEVERVLPLLRVTLKSDTRDWRSHLDQIRSHKQKMEDTMKSAQTHLEKLSADMSTSLDKIAMREKMLNTQLTGQLAKFRTAQDELRHATERYYVNGEKSLWNKNQGNQTLCIFPLFQNIPVGQKVCHVTYFLLVRCYLSAIHSCIVFTAPLINIKKAIAVLKSELKSVNIQIGVADHTLLQARLRDKNSVQNNAKIPAH
ncbi:intraflagellar transport protein 57 homolog [Diaphorina citri]|uniref:Intraflagellar transport protein 57 homolog n=1 Tax=Diaphorina citri TaxID=121845 RepID=A0A3Q0J0C6_DIACI|nr:intraflagellar transport protein 57 homolog [Diaphorina citri]